jgi:hypothetical protein
MLEGAARAFGFVPNLLGKKDAAPRSAGGGEGERSVCSVLAP